MKIRKPLPEGILLKVGDLVTYKESAITTGGVKKMGMILD